MGDSKAMQVAYTFREAPHHSFCFLQRQPSLAVDVLKKGSSFESLEDQVESLFGFEHALQFDHILMLEHSQQLDLLSKSLPVPPAVPDTP
jgi:hypothetical protein